MPNKYDNYYLLKNDSELVTMGAENVDNANNSWTCSAQGASVLYEVSSNKTGAVCHFFKVEESNIDSFECPNSFTDLELLSFENIKKVADLPKHFLLAVKLQENQDTTDTLREVKVFKANSVSDPNNQLIQILLSGNEKSKFCNCSTQ